MGDGFSFDFFVNISGIITKAHLTSVAVSSREIRLHSFHTIFLPPAITIVRAIAHITQHPNPLPCCAAFVRRYFSQLHGHAHDMTVQSSHTHVELIT